MARNAARFNAKRTRGFRDRLIEPPRGRRELGRCKKHLHAGAVFTLVVEGVSLVRIPEPLRSCFSINFFCVLLGPD
jgi:hypothetical protein